MIFLFCLLSFFFLVLGRALTYIEEKDHATKLTEVVLTGVCSCVVIVVVVIFVVVIIVVVIVVVIVSCHCKLSLCS